MNALVVNQCHHIHIATMNFTGFNGFPLSPLDAVYGSFLLFCPEWECSLVKKNTANN